MYQCMNHIELQPVPADRSWPLVALVAPMWHLTPVAPLWHSTLVALVWHTQPVDIDKTSMSDVLSTSYPPIGG